MFVLMGLPFDFKILSSRVSCEVGCFMHTIIDIVFIFRAMSGNFWNLKISDLPKWAKTNVSVNSAIRLPVTAACSYTRYYRGSARPMIHLAILATVVNYLFEFKHLRKHEALRKYH